MDLVVWRHAEAVELQDGKNDLDRALTARGYKQASRIAGWLDRQLPDNTRILSSPARRCQETARRLDRKYKLSDDLLLDAPSQQLLEAVQWPYSKAATLVVGHQPMLGQLIAQLLGLQTNECAIRKGSVWWLRSRERDGQLQTVLVAVQSADML
jgi:phosphohistidine phosphatase